MLLRDRGMKMKANRLVQLALLATIALTIFVVELRIPNPMPIPGVKLGLANIVTVYAVYYYRAKEVLLIVLTRIILGAMFSGQIMSLLYSLSGAMLCLAGMLLLRRVIPEKYLWVSSILGAVLHNIGQISTAMLVLRSPAVLAYFPILLVSGCLAGAFTGLCAKTIVGRKLRA